MKFKLPLCVLTVALISGCSSNNFKQIPYGCDSEESDPFCNSVENIYKSAVDNDDRSINVLAEDRELQNLRAVNTIQSQTSEPDGRSAPQPQQDARMANIAPAQHTNGLEQRPVYIPEKVHRVYRGPWRDDANILHSGEHLFYKTPGEWAFGSLKSRGSASGLVTPLAPEELGFSNVKENPMNTKRAGRHQLPSNKK